MQADVRAIDSAAGRLLGRLYDAAVFAAHPAGCLPAHLPAVPARGRLIVVGAGKAAAAMAQAAEAHYAARGHGERVTGVTTAPYGYAEALDGPRPHAIAIRSARHPTPDAASVAAAEEALALVAQAGPDDLVLVLLSGGASALWAAPVHGLDIAAKTALTRGLLKSGADIHEMNTVRRHISRIKGGRLAAAANGARVLTLAISDVPGDDPATIGSGPTVADPTTLADARAILARRQARMTELGLPIPVEVLAALDDPANETPKPGSRSFANTEYRIIATPAMALAAARKLAEREGCRVIDLGDQVTGEARDVAKQHAALAREARAAGGRTLILSGGELAVTVRNPSGRGGRCQEYALALAVALDGLQGVSAFAADTDGIDGGEGRTTDPAGAAIDDRTLARARNRRLDATMFLDNNDATRFFEALGDLVIRGPTQTNVNDFRAILIEG